MEQNKNDLSSISKTSVNAWEWLGDENSQLSINLKNIRDAVQKLYVSPKNKHLPFYTPHGPKHCETVETNLHKLLPDLTSNNLTEKERFFLLASAWVHDIGMLNCVADEIGYSKADHTEIRKQHHIIAEKYIYENFNECGILESDKKSLAYLCRYHRRIEPINNCPEYIIVDGNSLRLRLLAAYLRLADSLHIDYTRVPTSAYVICLAYDIPADAKWHWVKSKLVNGIEINPKEHSIKVEFQKPSEEQVKEKKIDIWTKNKIEKYITYIINDLRQELASVMLELTKAGLSYFLEIKDTYIYGIDEQLLDDLLSLVVNFDIMNEPSASRLLEMILIALANIAGFNITTNEKPIQTGRYNKNDEDIKNEIKEFLKKLESEVIRKRSCHFGLKVLLDRCNQIFKENLEKLNKFDSFIDGINNLYQIHNNRQIKIRENSGLFFKEFIKKNKLKCNLYKDPECTFNFLLFGYSELVIKALCGFRDSLISNTVNNTDPSKMHNSKYETDASSIINIFICDGQPKTQISREEKLQYHDGYSYAATLKERKFINLILIPDIVVGNIIRNCNIDFIMVGANGFSHNYFKHSAGHGSIISIVREFRNTVSKEKNESKIPNIVLVVSGEKYKSNVDDNKLENDSVIGEKQEQNLETNQYHLWEGPKKIPVRENIWAYSREFDIKGFYLYNPREDIVPIENLDYIICDKGWFPISSKENSIILENVNTFITAIKEQN